MILWSSLPRWFAVSPPPPPTSCKFKQEAKQGSPPAWTQEAYHPPCSKCSLCCSVWGVPHPDLIRGGVYPSPGQGVPNTNLSGGYPVLGYPPAGLGYPPAMTGVPPWKGPGTGAHPPPPPRNLGLEYLGVDRQTPVKTVPSHPSDASGNKHHSVRNYLSGLLYVSEKVSL